MGDSILSLTGAATANSASIGAMRAGQDISTLVMQWLLAGIEQTASTSLASPVDRVQLSPEAQRLLSSERDG